MIQPFNVNFTLANNYSLEIISVKSNNFLCIFNPKKYQILIYNQSGQ